MVRTKNRNTPECTKYFRPEISHCPSCGSSLEYCHTVRNKTVAMLSGVFRLVNMGYRCSNDDCPTKKTVYRSAQADNLAMKGVTFGMDVVALIGHLRFKYYRTRAEIRDELAARGIIMTDRTVQNLYECYGLLLRASSKKHIHKTLQKVTDEHGGAILSIDGVQPEKGNEVLWIVREVFTGTVLVAENLQSSVAAELKRILKPVLDMGYPIRGFVSDGQICLRKAIEELAPDSPYQYCQYHYLKDIAKPVVEIDRKLKTAIKKQLRGIRSVEKQAHGRDDVEAQLAQDYACALRSVLLESGKEPFDLPGLKVFEQTKRIHQSLQRCLSKKGASAPETPRNR